MSVVEPATRGRSASPSSYRAFGIDVVDLASAGARVSPSGLDRRVAVESRSSAEVEAAWRPHAATRVLERRTSDGRLVMAVDHAPELGFRVYAPRNGRHLVSPDGGRVVSAVPRIARWRWERLLFAQVLPLASTLQGLELLHASAVEWRGRTAAFVARAGTGKTSTAAHIVASGGTLLTDDVLALEELGGVIVGHSGVATLSIDEAELERMSPEGRRRLGMRIGRADKLVISAPVTARTNRLDGLYFLVRTASGSFSIEHDAVNPVRLLGNSFNAYVRTPERIVNQLAIAARVAETVPVFQVRVPVGVTATDVAREIITHMDTQ